MLRRKVLPDAPTGFEFIHAPMAAANCAAGVAANDEPEPLIPDCFIPADIGSRINPFRTYPIFYYGRARESDFPWIKQRLACLPDDPLLLHRVCVEYERLFLSASNADKRKVANSWLNAVALSFKAKAKQQRRVA